MENELKDFLDRDEFFQEGILTDVRGMVLTRKNLYEQYKELAFDDIDWSHFKYRKNEFHPTGIFKMSDLVIFVDENGKTKIMKNRWGNTGNVIKNK